MCWWADFMPPQFKIRGRNLLESHQFPMLNFCIPEFVLSHFSCVQLYATLWIVAHQALLSMGFSRQEYWTGLPCPPPGNLLNPGIEPISLMSPALASGFFTTSTTWEAPWFSVANGDDGEMSKVGTSNRSVWVRW